MPGWPGYVTVQMYMDDSGEIKGFPMNERATKIMQACQTKRNTPVFGDVFISRYYDDENIFRQTQHHNIFSFFFNLKNKLKNKKN